MISVSPYLNKFDRINFNPGHSVDSMIIKKYDIFPLFGFVSSALPRVELTVEASLPCHIYFPDPFPFVPLSQVPISNESFISADSLVSSNFVKYDYLLK